MTVQELRNAGYKVRVLHSRRDTFDGYRPKGGFTRVVIDSPYGEHFEGEAKCSDKDNYNKKLGVRIALGRCGLNFSKKYDKVADHNLFR